MAQLFRPATNTMLRAFLIGGPVVAILLGSLLAYSVAWSDWVTYKNADRLEQPVPFSHEHHVGELGIDCRFCHNEVEKSPFAGMPSTAICMTCHQQEWLHAPMLEPIRQSWATNTPLQWTRVHDLPDYVYFDHSIHVAKGVGCSTCHGDVSEMPMERRVVNLQMRWCIDCHREPEQHVRPLEEVFNIKWNEPPDQLTKGAALVGAYHIQKQQLTNCSVCHR